MTALTIYNVVDAGTPPTFAAAAASQTVDIGSGHNTFVVVKNGSGASVTAGITVAGNTDYGQPWPDPSITVAASAEVWIPIRKDYDPGDGSNAATVTVGGTLTSVTIAAVRVS